MDTRKKLRDKQLQQMTPAQRAARAASRLDHDGVSSGPPMNPYMMAQDTMESDCFAFVSNNLLCLIACT